MKMNKYMGIGCLLLWGVLPLAAQKNLLPAGRALGQSGTAGMMVNRAAVGGATAGAAAYRAGTVRQPVQSILPEGTVARLKRFINFRRKNIPASRYTTAEHLKQFINQLKENVEAATPAENVPLAGVPSSRVPKNLELAVYNSYMNVIDLWNGYFKQQEDLMPLLKSVFEPTVAPTFTSLQGNKMTFFFLRNLAAKIAWLHDRPTRGRMEITSVFGETAFQTFISRLEKEKLVFLGEIHHRRPVQSFLGKLIRQIKKQYPNRRVVLFTEFIDLPHNIPDSNKTLATYYRRVPQTPVQRVQLNEFSQRVDYAHALFLDLLTQNVEIYPLEDPTQKVIFGKEQMLDEDLSVFTLTQRNKVWARVIEYQMAQIRKTDPNALFLVYAGMGHTSWLAPLSLPKFFANEDPMVVEITEEKPSKLTLLYSVWGKEDAFFNSAQVLNLHFWKGKDARLLAKQTGFDYAFVVPKQLIAK